MVYNNLEPEFIIGLRVLASLHTGVITWSCHDCDDSMKDEFACTRPNDYLIWEHEYIGEFNNCPILWISQSVLDWYDEYLYYKTFEGTAPIYASRSTRFWDATKIYLAAINSFEADNIKNISQPKDKTSNSLNALKQGFIKKKNGHT